MNSVRLVVTRVAVFHQQPRHLVGKLGPQTHQSAPHPMQQLNILLLADFAGTKRICGRLIASQMASASWQSFLLDFTYGLTNWDAISRTVWPSHGAVLPSNTFPHRLPVRPDTEAYS